MKRPISLLSTYLITLLIAGALPREVSATPITQHLARASSSITFGIKSPNPNLRMTGSFREYNGQILLEPDNFAESSVTLTLTPSSAQLPPDQILQAVFLQTLLARITPRTNTFTSSRIEALSDTKYIVHGSYTWMNKRRAASVPVQMIQATPSRTEIRLLLDGSFDPTRTPAEFEQLASSAHGSTGWTKAVLIFNAQKR